MFFVRATRRKDPLAKKDNLDGLKLHAKRYGTDGVMQAGVELDLTYAQLCQLQTHIDGIVAQNKYAKKTRLSVETRVNRLLGIEEEDEAA
jgi:hypothetical protein